MSIKGDVHELKQLNSEIKRLQTRQRGRSKNNCVSKRETAVRCKTPKYCYRSRN